MKILLVNDYGSLHGGAEILTFGLRDRLRERGHDVRVFTSSAGRPGESRQGDYECYGTLSRYRTLLQTINPWAYVRLRRVLRDFQPDVVHVRMFLTQLSPLILPLLRRIPSLYHVVWYRPVCPLGTKTLPDGRPCRESPGVICYQSRCLSLRDWIPLMLQMWLWRRWRKVFDLVVANSEATRHSLISEGIGPVNVVWNGVPLQSLRPQLSDTPVVAYVGRLVHEKGVDVLLHAFRTVVDRIPKAKLLIIGDGNERDRLLKLIPTLELNSNVSMLGYLSRSEVERYCAMAWVQAVPSRWAEPFGLVAAEAMMRGTAVVATASGGLSEVIENGETGFLIPPGNVPALADVLIRLMSNRDLAEKIGEAGQVFARKHLTEASCIDRFVGFYYEICHGEMRTS